jgi:hypothetical protein
VALGAGAVFDFIFGIALQFGVQSFALDRWFGQGRSAKDIFTSYSEPTIMNLNAKIAHRLAFFSDAVALPIGAWLIFQVVVIVATVVALRRTLKVTAA